MKVKYNKLMIIGSGPIIIGQAAEFDYSGTQACKALKEEGIEIVLVNSNPATIMTDTNIADKVYIEPLNEESLKKIIEKERPQGLLAGFGGQTALNLAMQLKQKGILEKYNVELLGVKEDAIKKAEDREEFKKLMIEINEPIPESAIANSMEQCIEVAKRIGFPLIVRPAYTLGGTGGGFANNMDELKTVCERGLKLSPINQVLIEQSVAGWKEIEYEVIRDGKDNCIIVCNMENVDPVGVHTGDSIVVAPSQTLNEKQYQMLRNASIKIVRSLNIEGGCNVQFALDPNSDRYIVIEVNPRVSRSSALASKAAGYPIAKIAAKIAIGYSLDELKNYVTKCSSAFFEPAIDYVVLKIPKWPFDKFSCAKRSLGTQMKATGEVMAIDRTFESALLKAISCLEGNLTGLRMPSIEKLGIDEVIDKIKQCDDERIFAISRALRLGIDIDRLYELTKIDKWFLNSIKNIVDIENELKEKKLNKDTIKKAELMGFTDDEICNLTGATKDELDNIRKEYGIYPVYKMVDTCSSEFEAQTPYYYSCYESEDESFVSSKEKVVVIGSGPIRIGQGIEFDYCCVHGVWAAKSLGYEAIIINNNPETVSTDFDTADKLYFESLYIDDVLNVIRKEKPVGVFVQLGGQTAINLAKKLQDRGVKILGTSVESIDIAEDRDKFRLFLEKLNIPTPKGCAVTKINEVLKAAQEIGYPVVVRPSYVIGGRAMRIIYDEKSLIDYMNMASNIFEEYQVIVDKYIRGTEIEVDAICDGEDVLIPGIMEHVERTGVHSGDSVTIYPTVSLSDDVIKKLVDYTKKIAIGLKTVGLINIQYVYDGKDVYVIEVNPRASRTVPILSKVTGVPMVKLAVEAAFGKKLKDSEYGTGLLKSKDYYVVKVPVFSNEKIADADIFLGPEMKSTGEVLGVAQSVDVAAYKAFTAAGIPILNEGNMYVSLNDYDKFEAVHIIKEYEKRGFKILSSEGTAKVLIKEGIECEVVDVDEVLNMLSKGKIDFVINTPTVGNINTTTGFKIRKRCAELKVPLFTCIDTLKIYLKAVDVKRNDVPVIFSPLSDYLSN